MSAESARQLPHSFNGVQFRAVGRQGHNEDSLGKSWVARSQVEAGLIGDDHMQGLRIARPQMVKEETVAVQIHGGQMEELGLADINSHEPDPALFGYVLDRLLQNRPIGSAPSQGG